MADTNILPERALGTQGFRASAMGYGCVSLTDFYGPNTAAGAEETLKHVLETGVTIINTAELLPESKKKGATVGQLALAWVLARGDDIIPIPGTKRGACIDENVAAVHIKLTHQELQELEDAVPRHQVAGDRYADMKRALMKFSEEMKPVYIETEK